MEQASDCSSKWHALEQACPKFMVLLLSAASILLIYSDWFQHLGSHSFSMVEGLQIYRTAEMDQNELIGILAIMVFLAGICALFYCIGITKLLFHAQHGFPLIGVASIFAICVCFVVFIFISSNCQEPVFLTDHFFLFCIVSMMNCYASWKLALAEDNSENVQARRLVAET